jgi:NAD(P)-dependent dehydrogenase (short-subunit alcohol dehydrogenase family)
MDALAGRRILVIGASSGLGRASALAFCEHGAEVVFSARRADALERACADAGAGHVVTIDVTDEADIVRAVSDAVGLLGGLDGILYTAGASPLAPMTSLDMAEWQRVYAINTFGPSLVIKHALPHLAPDAVVGVVSSDSSQHPRYGLVPYGSSKRAMEATMEGWRTEVLGGRRFFTIVLGPTQPTEFANSFDPDVFEATMPHWARQGFSTGFMAADDVGQALAANFGAMFAAPTFGIESALLRAPEPETPVDYATEAIADLRADAD